MKGCLKHTHSTTTTPLPSPGLPPAPPCTPALTSAGLCAQKRKCVAWCISALEEVHVADDWDRTPTEPAKNLSYQDMLELKEIQRSLPLANQPFDPFTHKPAAQYLTTVPINLLPLLPESPCSSTPPLTPSRSSPFNAYVSGSSSRSTLPADGSCPSFLSTSPLTSPQSSQLRTEQHLAVRPGRLFPHGIPSRSTSPSPDNSRSSSPSQSSKPPLAKPPICILPLADPFSTSSPSTPKSPPLTTAAPRATLPTHLSHLTHLLPSKSPSSSAPKRGFTFLPLLETPPSSASTTPMSSVFTTPIHSAVTSTVTSPVHSPSEVVKALEECVSRHDNDDEAEHTDASSDVGGSSTRSYDPPTPSLTNASLDSSPPVSRASSMSPELVTKHISEVPTAIEKDQGYFPNMNAYMGSNDAYSHQPGHLVDHSPVTLPPALRTMRLSAMPSPALIPPSPLNLSLTPGLRKVPAPSNLCSDAEPLSPTLLENVQPIAREPPKPKKAKKKQVIVINDEEIEIGGDSEDDDEYEGESEAGSSASGSVNGGGFVGMRNSRFSRSMGERMVSSSSSVFAFEDEDSLSRSPTAQEGGFAGVAAMLGLDSTTPAVATSPSSTPTMESMSSKSTLAAPALLQPKLPSPALTPTPSPPPEPRAVLLTPMPSPPPEFRCASGLVLGLGQYEYEHGEDQPARPRTPTLPEIDSFSGAYNGAGTGQQVTPPPSEPGSPRQGTVPLPGSSLPGLSSSPVAIPGKVQEATPSSSLRSSPTYTKGCFSPVSSIRSGGSKPSTTSSRLSCSPRLVSTSPKLSSSPKCVGAGSAVARKRASMSPRSSPVLA